MVGEDFSEQVGEIISESWARSARNQQMTSLRVARA
jgi:hypothetical protein